MTAASSAKRLLIQTHRWLGILVGVVAIIWFASGIAMIYVGGMPRLTSESRLAHLPALDVSRVQLTPAQAAVLLDDEAAGPMPAVPQLMMVQKRPAYRFIGDRTVFADDGAQLAPLDEPAASVVARQFLGTDAPELRLAERLLTPDQWTLSMRRWPLLKYEAGDAQSTQLYVSPTTAEVVLLTTRSDRAKAWIATIPHWLYFSALRQNQPMWYRVVVWFSALVCVLVAMGLLLAIVQWRPTRPLDLKRAIPYGGGMRWHYIAGVVFGVFALTWAFSGLLSVEPFEWTKVRNLDVPPNALTGGSMDLSSYDGIDWTALPALVAPRSIKEIGFTRIHGEHYLELRTTAHEAVLVAATSLERRDKSFDTETILAGLRSALPDVPVIERKLLFDYDDYYYSRRGEAPLPVLRVKFGDALQTWLYIDPRSSELVANVHRYSRVERWLYNGLHSLDFRFWYAKRPLWDLGMIMLLLGGLAASSLGLYYGVRRLVR
jgi:hypothetical protein